ncbi:MAG TPA: glycolate oxidase subunit GlcE [Gallionellaceae bacterium]|nr:glycolate oxidase subunit GlcE [Gallionellaceae bacterium]
MQHIIEQFSRSVRAAGATHSPLRIQGAGSKAFYGRTVQGTLLDVTPYRGIVSYEPTELVLTARAGTPLAEIEAALAAKRQMLPFEPPHFGVGATLGGCIAAGLSGPRRAYAGSARDYVLGVRMLDGNGEDLKFGGQVMKNVAGYDVSRLMAGSMGTLGLLLEVSLKVLPVPAEELTLRFDMSEAEALDRMNRWAAQPLSLSATCYHDGALTVRLSGASAAVNSVRKKLGGAEVKDAHIFWHSVREQQHAFFAAARTLWRLSLPSTAASVGETGAQLIEWGGALRWLATDASPEAIRQAATVLGGHATLFRSAAPVVEPFQPLSAPLLEIHKRLKQRFDPHHIFNPGRMFPEL